MSPQGSQSCSHLFPIPWKGAGMLCVPPPLGPPRAGLLWVLSGYLGRGTSCSPQTRSTHGQTSPEKARDTLPGAAARAPRQVLCWPWDLGARALQKGSIQLLAVSLPIEPQP